MDGFPLHLDDDLLEREIGQLLMPSLDAESALRHEVEIRAGLIGGCLATRDAFDSHEMTAFSKKMRSWSPRDLPFLIAVDHEGGAMFTQRRFGTSFPGNMALGATQDEKLTERTAVAMGRELRSLGIHINFAPVLDVNVNPLNPIIGVRSFGENSKEVARHARAATLGYLRSGIFPVLKHFPGHGDTFVDSHSGLPIIKKDFPRISRGELLPFKAAFRARAPLIMSAHILFPKLDPKNPATFSKKILDGLLRQRLKFKGLVISDGLDMGAISRRWDIEDACVLALAGGCDLLLIGTSDAKRARLGILKAVQSGKLPAARVHEAFSRVQSFKKKILNPERSAIILSRKEREETARLAKNIAEKSATLLRNRGSLLPLKLNPREILLLITISPKRYAAELRTLESQVLRRHHLTRSIKIDAELSRVSESPVLKAAARAGVVVIGTFSWGDLPHLTHASLIQKLLTLKKKTVLVSLMNPYDLRHYPQARTVLCSYGMTQPALEASVRLIFGEMAPRGKLPVSIPGAFSKGAGLRSFNR